MDANSSNALQLGVCCVAIAKLQRRLGVIRYVFCPSLGIFISSTNLNVSFGEFFIKSIIFLYAPIIFHGREKGVKVP